MQEKLFVDVLFFGRGSRYHYIHDPELQDQEIGPYI